MIRYCRGDPILRGPHRQVAIGIRTGTPVPTLMSGEFGKMKLHATPYVDFMGCDYRRVVRITRNHVKDHAVLEVHIYVPALAGLLDRLALAGRQTQPARGSVAVVLVVLQDGEVRNRLGRKGIVCEDRTIFEVTGIHAAPCSRIGSRIPKRTRGTSPRLPLVVDLAMEHLECSHVRLRADVTLRESLAGPATHDCLIGSRRA